MKRAFLTLALIATLTSPVFVNAAADTVVDKGAGLIGSGISATTKFLGFDQVGTLLDALRPDTKNCSYVGKQLYQPFSGIDNKFPGAETLGVAKGAKDPRVTCISVTGGTEGLLRMLFTAGIAVVIALSVIGIAVSGLRYMTEEAVGKKGEAKRKLQNSLIGLFLGLMSYTVLYAVNRQLTNFAFNPVDLDPTGAVAKGAAEAAQAAKLAKLGVGTAGIEGTQNQVNVVGGYDLPAFNLYQNNAMGNYATNAEFGGIRCSGTTCFTANPTVFGYRDGNGTVGRKGDNGVGSTVVISPDKSGCAFDTGNTVTTGVAIPLAFWRSAGIPDSELPYIGIKVYVNGEQKRILPLVDISELNMDFTFAAAKAFLDPNITNSNSLNFRGNVTFEIIKGYYQTNARTNVVYTSNNSTFTNKLPCNK